MKLKYKKILILGSSALKIGEAGEFDYSGSQAIKALKEEGIKTVLINPNIATIQTSDYLADRVYLLPVTPEFATKVIQRERPDGILLSFGGQTALNCGLELFASGVLKKYKVQVLGTPIEAIENTEDRQKFTSKLSEIKVKFPQSKAVNSVEEALKYAEIIGFPIIIRIAYALGGLGSGICRNKSEVKKLAARALNHSSQILVEEYLEGWKEIEYEVVRDRYDNCITVCNMENFDPMGIHTGDSITVAPAQTLTDKEYQMMRDASIAVIREIGVETGGSNIQFAINPVDGHMVIIEMNPRVSRSSALASKATGFPIAKMAAKLAVGYTLDEIPNDITKKTPACFEPTIDYCVVKIPRFTFEKFPGANDRLTTAMKSVGEAMSIGRTFKESLQKGLRSLEIKVFGLEGPKTEPTQEVLESELRFAGAERIFYLKYALEKGMGLDQIFELTRIDRWFLHNMKELVEFEQKLKGYKGKKITAQVLLEAKTLGFSDHQLGRYWDMKETEVYKLRQELNVMPEFKQVDTCAAEFEAYTPYYYSTYS